jgi:hypothetical protein
MLSYDTFDPISASQDTGLGDIAVGEFEDNFAWVLFDFDQTLAELDVLDGYEAGHDFEQCLPVCLLDGVSNLAIQQSGERDRPICDRSQGVPMPTCRTTADLDL